MIDRLEVVNQSYYHSSNHIFHVEETQISIILNVFLCDFHVSTIVITTRN